MYYSAPAGGPLLEKMRTLLSLIFCVQLDYATGDNQVVQDSGFSNLSAISKLLSFYQNFSNVYFLPLLSVELVIPSLDSRFEAYDG